MLEHFQYAASALGVIAIFMINFKPKLIRPALLIAIACGVCWTIYGLAVNEYMLAASQVVYTIFNCVGYYKWSNIKLEET